MNMDPCNKTLMIENTAPTKVLHKNVISLFEFSRLNLATSFVNIFCFYKTSKRVKTNQKTAPWTLGQSTLVTEHKTKTTKTIRPGHEKFPPGGHLIT